MKLLKPKIKELKNYDLKSANKDNYFYGYKFKKCEFVTLNIEDNVFDSCMFCDIDFTNINLEKIDLIDCIFKNCDLSNKKFDYRLIERVEFINCRMLGISFIEASLKDVLIKECKVNYANFSDFFQLVLLWKLK